MKNVIHVQRLKNKVGNRSNASGDVEFHDAWGQLLGEEGRGVSTILEMGTYTRLDCVIGTAGLMRQAVVQAIHHAHHRHVFGQALIASPLMQNVLADLAIESEAATVLALWLAHAFDEHENSAAERSLVIRRIMTSACKFWVCKRGPQLAAEAMEVLGGNGYVEEGVMGRIYREMSVNSIWEGSGNVMCLDVLRSLARTPHAVDLLLDELARRHGLNADYDAAFERLAGMLRASPRDERDARRLVQRLVTQMQASLLLVGASMPVAEAFCASRLAGDGAPVFGLLGAKVDVDAIIERAWPKN